MHVKQVILQGFKSYGPRTDVGNFDPHFNAITGLNGSGKSNILDGIIFVLGISSLGNVRADRLQDLIHKGGGCKRGSVSVVFDNTDKRHGKCPLGFEKYDEIVVSRTIEETGQCKYHLNMLVATKKKIVDMFESVQLNIANPNFVIQQGRITKVVNMKPKEILHMIEETVGATVYQTKRDKTEKDLTDKDHMLSTVRQTMKDVIEPALAEQRKASEYLNEFNSLKSEANARGREYAIAAYSDWTKALDERQNALDKLKTQEQNDKCLVKEIETSVGEKKKQIAEIKESNNTRVQDRLGKAEQEAAKARRDYDKGFAQHESAISNKEKAVKRVQQAEKNFKNEEKHVQDFTNKSANSIAESNAIQAEIQTAEQNMKEAKDRESEINAGKVLGDDGEVINLRERLIVLEDEINEVQPKRDHEAKFVSNETKSLRQKEAELARTQSDESIEKDFRTASNDVNKLKQELEHKNIVPEEYPSLDTRHHNLMQELQKHEENKRRMTRENTNFIFEYSDPMPNFDRRKVHGFLLELFTFKEDQIAKYGKSLEIGCGGFFFNVIVDNPEISKALITRGNLHRRTTFMPISKMQGGRLANQNQLDSVLGRGKAVRALDLIEYDQAYKDVMEYYFGRLVICEDMQSAKTVAFNLKYKSVTLGGEVIDPEGVMQGGARKNIGRLVESCQRYSKLVSSIRGVKNELAVVKERLDYYKRYENLIRSFETASRKLKSFEETRKCTAYATLSAEVAELKEQIAKRNEAIKVWDMELKKLTKEATNLKSKLDREDEVKAKNLKEIKAQMDKYKKILDAANKKFAANQKSYKDVDLEVLAKKALLSDLEKEIEKEKNLLEEADATIATKKAELEELQANHKEKDEAVENILKENRLYDEEINNLEEQIKQSLKKKQALEITKIKRDNELGGLTQKVKGLEKLIADLQTEYDQINFEDENLPKPTQPASELKNIVHTAQKRLDEMRTKVNVELAEKLEITIEGARKADYRSKLVEKNRNNIQAAINTLDDQKLKIVTEAYSRINAEFGIMMNTLLPEAHAKLVQVNKDDLSEGLNIHVQLGGVWKESLTELSGGQRSLVALALVLSLCMFNPAPFYVLDEVDAALDLSHTQNMGVIIQQRFKDTQFICVSLKEGMYTNANVLFTVTFLRGLSTVARRERTLTRGEKRPALPQSSNQPSKSNRGKRNVGENED